MSKDLSNSNKDTSLVLPEDCSELFKDGRLQRVPTDADGEPLQGFEDAEEGDPVSDFDLSSADTSNVEDMSGMFEGKVLSSNSFNQDISGWDTSNVTDMSGMFFEAESFNQDISDWNVSSVEDMTSMFHCAESFNQDISDWDTSNVETMEDMFVGASSFNRDISSLNWNLDHINEAFPDEKFNELCEQMSYGVFEDKELQKLDEEKIKALVEHNIIDEGTGMAYTI